MSVNIVAISLSRLLVVILGVISLTMMGSLLSTEEVGEYYYLIAISSVLSTVFLTPLGSYWEAKATGRIEDFPVVFFTQLIQVVILVLICLIPFYFFAKILSVNMVLVLFLGISTFLFSNACHLVNIYGLQIFAAFMSALGAATLVFVLYFSSQIHNLNSIYWGSCIILSNVLCFFIILARVLVLDDKLTLRKVISKFKAETNKELVWFCLPVLVVTSLVWGQQQLFRIAVESFAGMSFLGVISYCFAISIAAYSACDTIFQQIIFPKLISRISLEKENKEKLQVWRDSYYSAQFIFSLFVFLGVSIFSKVVLKYIGGGEYSEYWIIVILGAGIETVKSNINARYLLLRLLNKPKTAIVPNFTLVVMLLISCCVLLIIESYIFLSITILISYFFASLVFKFKVSKLVENDRHSIFDKLINIGLSILFLSFVLFLQSKYNEILVALISASILLTTFSIWFYRNKNDYL